MKMRGSVSFLVGACLGLLLVSIVIQSAAMKAPLLATKTTRSAKNSDLNDSKRRVPNGPDPIHNRGAGKSGRPPGKA